MQVLKPGYLYMHVLMRRLIRHCFIFKHYSMPVRVIAFNRNSLPRITFFLILQNKIENCYIYSISLIQNPSSIQAHRVPDSIYAIIYNHIQQSLNKFRGDVICTCALVKFDRKMTPPLIENITVTLDALYN